ncbi:hypothetical protein HUJ04_001481 [Dendroctonus ponderosae]|nr:hypothetical protein HUJ04_001481 [Dendroctonus ponderosae]
MKFSACDNHIQLLEHVGIFGYKNAWIKHNAEYHHGFPDRTVANGVQKVFSTGQASGTFASIDFHNQFGNLDAK